MTLSSDQLVICKRTELTEGVNRLRGEIKVVNLQENIQIFPEIKVVNLQDLFSDIS